MMRRRAGIGREIGNAYLSVEGTRARELDDGGIRLHSPGSGRMGKMRGAGGGGKWPSGT